MVSRGQQQGNQERRIGEQSIAHHAGALSLQTGPAAPTLLAPGNNVLNLPPAMTFAWTSISGATTYDIKVATNSTFLPWTLVVDQTGLTSNSIFINSLSLNQTYYWKARGRTGNQEGTWSPTWTFSTAILTTPVLVSPDSGATGKPLTTTLSWNTVPGATHYRLIVATTSNYLPASIILDDSTITATSRTLTGLTASTNYYWKIRARNANNNQKSGWSNVWKFTSSNEGNSNAGNGGNSGGGTTGSGGGSNGSGVQNGMLAPWLYSPSNGSVGMMPTLKLIWNAVATATSYDLQVATDAAFNNLIVNDASLAVTSRTVSGLNASTSYYWRARGKNGNGNGPWSGAYIFTTNALPSMTGLPVKSSRPRVLIDSAERAAMLSRKVAGNPNYGNWVVLQNTANVVKQWPVTPYSDANRVIWFANTIQYNYQGSGYYDAAFQLSLAYLISGDTSYSNKALAIADEMVRAEYDTTNQIGPLQVDHSFPSRFLCPAMAVIYDWCNDQLGAPRKAKMIATMNRWFDSLRAFNTYAGYQANGPATGNYFGGHLYGVGLMGYATAGDNPRAQELIDWSRARFDGTLSSNLAQGDIPSGNRVQAFQGQLSARRATNWGAPTANTKYSPFKGGFPLQGWGYTGDEWGRMIDYMLTVNAATGENVVGQYQQWFQDIFHSQRHAMFPGSILMDPFGDWGGNQGAVIFHELPTRLAYVLRNTPDSAGAQHFAFTQLPQNGGWAYYAPNLVVYPRDPWLGFLFHDRTLTSDSLELPPYYSGFGPAYPAGGGGNGAMPKFVMRSDWSKNATWATLDMMAAFFDDHQHYRAGHISLVRGNDQLLVDAACWRGTAPGLGVIGAPIGYGANQSSLKNTLFIDDYNVYSSNSPLYSGGQGQWGHNEVVANEQNDNYSYVRGDLTSAYDLQDYPAPVWADTVKRPLNYFYRNFLYLRQSNLFVVYDQVNVKNSTHANGQYRKELRWHFPIQPTVNGSRVTVTHNNSRLFLHTLLPASPTITAVNENNNPDNKWGAGYNYLYNMPTWRVEVKDAANPLTLPFLTVMQVGDINAQEMTSTTLQSDDGLMTGARITSGGITNYVLFNNRSGQVQSPITTTSYTITGSSTAEHTLCGLVPGGAYQVSVNGATVMVTQQAGGNYTASAAGALQFQTGSGGNKLISPLTGERNDAEGSISLNVAPNPATSGITLNYHLPVATESLRLTITDVLGKVVASYSIAGARAGDHSTRIDLSTIKEIVSGTWFARIEGGKQTAVCPFVVAR